VLVAKGHPRLPLYRLLPKPLPTKPCAGVLAIHGHGGVYSVVGLTESASKVSEAKDSNFDYGRRLAKAGYIVVAPCMSPFNPREPNPASRTTDPCAVTFVRMQLLGKVLMAENLRDCLWGVELLAQDKRVDAKRLGCVGLSYGGRMTMLTTALEPRIRVCAISGACNVMQERIQLRYSCGAQVIPGLLQYGDVPEISSLIAPRPCVWEIGSKDSLIDPLWAKRALERIGRAYEAAGAKDKLVVDRFEGGHIWNGKVAVPLMDKVLSAR
jgi:dienelactone hydrolase